MRQADRNPKPPTWHARSGRRIEETWTNTSLRRTDRDRQCLQAPEHKERYPYWACERTPWSPVSRTERGNILTENTQMTCESKTKSRKREVRLPGTKISDNADTTMTQQSIASRVGVVGFPSCPNRVYSRNLGKLFHNFFVPPVHFFITAPRVPFSSDKRAISIVEVYGKCDCAHDNTIFEIILYRVVFAFLSTAPLFCSVYLSMIDGTNGEPRIEREGVNNDNTFFTLPKAIRYTSSETHEK